LAMTLSGIPFVSTQTVGGCRHCMASAWSLGRGVFGPARMRTDHTTMWP
jgi:hypothetical protein